MSSIRQSQTRDLGESAGAALFSLPQKTTEVPPRFSLGEFYTVWESVQPNHALVLIYGDHCATELAQRILQRPLLAQDQILIMDGCNDFSISLFSRMAQRLGQGPEKFLRSIRMSRAFTCSEMISLTERVVQVSEKHKPSLVVALGPLTPFYDEKVPHQEADKWFAKFHEKIQRLSGMGIRLLLACPEAPSRKRSNYLEFLKRDAVLRLACERWSDSQVLLHLESPEEFKQSWSLTPSLGLSVRYLRQLKLF